MTGSDNSIMYVDIQRLILLQHAYLLSCELKEWMYNLCDIHKYSAIAPLTPASDLHCSPSSTDGVSTRPPSSSLMCKDRETLGVRGNIDPQGMGNIIGLQEVLRVV